MSSKEVQDKIIALVKTYIDVYILRDLMLLLNELDSAARREMMEYVRKYED